MRNSSTSSSKSSLQRLPWAGLLALALLLVIDRLAGELEAAQAERGRPAYFVLMSDNGMSWGQQGFPPAPPGHYWAPVPFGQVPYYSPQQ